VLVVVVGLVEGLWLRRGREGVWIVRGVRLLMLERRGRDMFLRCDDDDNCELDRGENGESITGLH